MKTLTKSNVIHGQIIKRGKEELHVAKEDPSEYDYPWIDSANLHQYTTCKKCKTKLISWAKRAICPKCNKKVYLT